MAELVGFLAAVSTDGRARVSLQHQVIEVTKLGYPVNTDGVEFAIVQKQWE